MILTDFLRALSQFGSDARFRRVLWRGVGLTLALLIAACALVVWGVGLFVGDAVTLPWIGTVTWVDNAAGFAAIPLMLVLSIFLMVPVASAITSLFLEDVAQAVEDRHYPAAGTAGAVPLGDQVQDSLGFFATLIAANAAALVLYLFVAPLAPFIFWGLNGFLLGREYFTLAAMRRVGRAQAKVLRKRHRLTIWAAGVMMAVPLTIPVINLAVPVLGAATFTHLFHRVTRGRA
ncbi:EI24 domain-containing protein [Citreimonas salinaria]|uniref:Uncharacterized protein involved in cysteine biosynthesis n=1 Tax=Citreimonas salinaria TaxID=321339 RepID=A0A1H3FM40_9RHOB|nr:EI24 domain-containing protein [Citreimonas salinaria]SDX91448.1 Uncharacterized protein involved in cysteine biosynthesis [Citreimonas salinaria]